MAQLGHDPGEQDLYAVLGVTCDAAPQAITRAFRVLVRELHPDTGTVDARTGVERLARVQAAYRVLHDPARREAYDRRRAATAEAAARYSSPAQPQPQPQPRQRPLSVGPPVVGTGAGADDDVVLLIGPTVWQRRS